jgi:protein dithiol oxidoreductase (disulfide-forming)
MPTGNALSCRRNASRSDCAEDPSVNIQNVNTSRSRSVATAVVLANLLLGLLSVAAFAKDALVEGRDYVTLPGLPAKQESATIKVVEFFSYACPTCDAFQPYLNEWSHHLPKGVNFTRIPVTLGYSEWGVLVRTFYALEQTGDLARLDQPLYDALHKENKDLFDANRMAAWAAQHGVPAKKFLSAYNSATVANKAALADETARSYGIDATPRLVIDGRYLVLGAEAESFEEVLEIATQLIEKAAARKTI